MSETKFVITCDYEWAEHGEDDAASLPQDVFTLAEARRVATNHQHKFPSHTTFRVWSFLEAIEKKRK